MPDLPDLTAIILAGGKSSRMGQDKALLEIDGQSLLRRTFDVLTPLVAEVIVVTPWRDRYGSHLPLTVTWVTEPLDHRGQTQGPLVGFAQGLRQVSTSWTLAIACDLPRLTTAAIAGWYQALPQLLPSTLAYLPHSQGWWDPLCGFYRRSSLIPLDACISAGGRSFQTWLSTIPVQAIPDIETEMLFNLNTPLDWQRLHQS